MNTPDLHLVPPPESATGIPELDDVLARGEDPDATITRLMSEGASFEDASERACQLHELAATLGLRDYGPTTKEEAP